MFLLYLWKIPRASSSALSPPLHVPPPGPGWDLLLLDFTYSFFFSCLDFSRFCVGDKFFLKNNMILCQMDYEEGQLNGTFESQVQ